MHETRTLARFAVETHFHDLPGGLIEECKIAVLDALAAGFIGTTLPWSQRALAMVYTEEAVHDPVVRALAQRIELLADDTLAHAAADRWQAVIVIECAAQTYTLHTHPHKGSPANPYTWSDIGEKFRRYTAYCLSGDAASATIEAVGELEQVRHMDRLAAMLANNR
jgi:2-methylcitrate dehydratase PrpD